MHIPILNVYPNTTKANGKLIAVTFNKHNKKIEIYLSILCAYQDQYEKTEKCEGKCQEQSSGESDE